MNCGAYNLKKKFYIVFFDIEIIFCKISLLNLLFLIKCMESLK